MKEALNRIINDSIGLDVSVKAFLESRVEFVERYCKEKFGPSIRVNCQSLKF